METVGLDKHELPPTNQKRMVAFINHFVLSTVHFLNRFALDCENKFIQYEHKMQSLEASLLIIEAKLASIDALKGCSMTPQKVEVPAEATTDEVAQVQEEVVAQERDPRYERYFKMIQVGVPVPAVRNKISSEGLDPNYIDAFL
ncbi:WASH complex subunit 3 [Culex pipiens pallens]|uniref:WASH complex subunit 3 n=1 Tax=Culex pipiens pallens TaxID=42434 RepID=UPI0019534A07|nr:WASH complex subunit 3 [Culex pipiens pallens]